MARYKCPCCGAAYNGRKCSSCYYEQFTEEIAHGNHTHKGEPLVVKAPVRQPIPRKDPFGCEPKTRKKTRNKFRRPGLSFLILCLVFLSPILTRLLGAVAMVDDLLSAPEPEPEPGSHWDAEITVPEDSLVLYQDEDFLIAAGWQDGQEFPGDFPVYVRNDSSRDIAVSAREIWVNDYFLEYSYLYCDVQEDTTGMGSFYLEERDRLNTGIGAVQDISFCLNIYDTETYETLVETPMIHLTAAVPEGASLGTEPEGEIIFEQEGIRVKFLGFAYSPDSYDPYAFEDSALLFHIENDTQQHLSFSIEEPSFSGNEVDLFLWSDLLPGTKAVSSIHLYGLDQEGIYSVEDIPQFTFRLRIDDWEDYQFTILTDPITVSVTD